MEFVLGRGEGLPAHPHRASRPWAALGGGSCSFPPRFPAGSERRSSGSPAAIPFAPRLPCCRSGVSSHGSVLGSPVTWRHLPAAGSVSWQVHRHRLHAALLQADAEQAAHAEGPGIHRPRVLQLHRLDKVSAPCCPPGPSRGGGRQVSPHSPSLLLVPPSEITSQCPPAGRTAWRSVAWSCTSSRTWRSWAR